MSIGNCGCSTVSLPSGPAGATGPAGADGTDGLFGGYSLEWSFDTTTTSGTSSTKVRLNNATYNLVTTIYVNDSNIDSTDSSAFLASMGSPYGLIKLFKEDNSNVFWLGEVTAIADSGTEYALTVTYVLHNGTFSNNDNVVVSFAKNGASGTSTNGTTVLDVDIDYATNNTTSSSYATVKTLGIVADTIGTVDDFIRVEFDVIGDNTAASTPYSVRIQFDGNTMLEAANILNGTSGNAARGYIDFIVTGTNTITPYILWSISNGIRTAQMIIDNPDWPETRYVNTSAAASITLNSGTRNITIDLKSDGTNNISLTSFKAYKMLK